jgi:membrane associated rhomboid family serine protease
LLIPTRSEKQAMDWSLALASQQIACAIRALPSAAGWALEVDPRDAGPALRTLRAYLRENRDWNRALGFSPGSEAFPFQWTVLLWCFLMAIVHSAAEAPGSQLPLTGRFETARFVAGEWWRPITATFLHGNLDHLVANLTSGFIVLGLALGRFKVGPALLLSLLAGSAANLVAWLLRARDYIGLGASGVVMAGLGMLAVSLVAEARGGRVPAPVAIRGVLGGTALFILLGTAPQSDVLAHAAGFVMGAAVAMVFNLLPARIVHRPGFDLACAAGFLATAGTAWWAALR